MVLGIDGSEVLVQRRWIDQRVRSSARHDGPNYGHLPVARQSDEEPRCLAAACCRPAQFGFRPGGAPRIKRVAAVRRKAGHGQLAIGTLRHKASLAGPNDGDHTRRASDAPLPQTSPAVVCIAWFVWVGRSTRADRPSQPGDMIPRRRQGRQSGRPGRRHRNRWETPTAQPDGHTAVGKGVRNRFSAFWGGFGGEACFPGPVGGRSGCTKLPRVCSVIVSRVQLGTCQCRLLVPSSVSRWPSSNSVLPSWRK